MKQKKKSLERQGSQSGARPRIKSTSPNAEQENLRKGGSAKLLKDAD